MLTPWWASGSNDSINNLGTGFGQPPPDVRRALVDTARGICQRGNWYCELYAHVIEKDYSWNYGVSSIAARLLWLRDLGDFGRAAISHAAAVAVFSGAIAVLLFAAQAWRLQRQNLALLLVIMTGSILLFFVPYHGWNALTTVSGNLLRTCATLALACLASLLLVQRLQFAGTAADYISRWLPRNGSLGWMIVLLLTITAVACRTIFPGHPLGAMAAGFAIAAGLLVTVQERKLDWLEAGLLGSALLIIAIMPYHHTVQFLPVPRGQAALVAIPLLLVVLHRPNSPVAYLLPTLVLFHVSAAVLASAVLLAAEAVACAWERRPTRLLVASALTLAIAFGLSRMFISDSSAAFAGLPEVVGLAIASPIRMLNAALAGLACLTSALVVLARGGNARSALGRALLLIGVILVLYRISALLNWGDPANLLRPHTLVLFHASQYVAETLLPGTFLALLAALTGLPDRRGAAHAVPHLTPAVVLLIIGLLVVRIDNQLAPLDPFARTARAVQILVSPSQIVLNQPGMANLRFDDDDYLIPRSAPTMSALTYLSLLKLRMRQEQQSQTIGKARIRVLDE
jgi:hypothetical protein